MGRARWKRWRGPTEVSPGRTHLGNVAQQAGSDVRCLMTTATAKMFADAVVLRFALLCHRCALRCAHFSCASVTSTPETRARWQPISVALTYPVTVNCDRAVTVTVTVIVIVLGGKEGVLDRANLKSRS